MLANSFKFKPAQGPCMNPLAFLNSEISCPSVFYRVYGQWSVLLANSKSEGGPSFTEYLAVLVESRIKCEVLIF